MTLVEIPYEPRKLQSYLHENISKHRFSCIVMHRRAGKSVMAINHLIRDAASTKREMARYGFLTGTYKQAKSIVWDYLKMYTAPIPGVKYHETELRCDLPNGARIELLGADNYQTLRGRFFDGIVMDEMADMPEPVLPTVVRPALADRQGYLIVTGTPRGHNAFYELYHESMKDDAWFCHLAKASDTGILPTEELEAAKTMMSISAYEQEFECSWAANIEGAVYGRELQKCEQDTRITHVPYDTRYKVNTAWDLGVADATAIWFFQNVGKAIHVIDYYEQRNEGLPHFARILEEWGYLYGYHQEPHDIDHREIGTGKSRLETAYQLGINFRVCKKIPIEDGIHAAQMALSRCWFDYDNCEQGLQALNQYHRAYNERTRSFRMSVVHDWSSHGADAFRYLAVGLEDNDRLQGGPPQNHAIMEYSVFGHA